MACRSAPSAEDGRALAALAAKAKRRIGILAVLGDGLPHGAVTPARLGEVCKSQTGMTGAGIMLMSGDQPVGSACATDDVSALIEELQFTFGEGPGIDAWRLDRPVVASDLAAGAAPRWPAFTGPAVHEGVRAAFAFPVRVGSVRVGILNLYADRPGSLTNDQHHDALAVAEVAAEMILSIQAGALQGAAADRLQPGSNFHDVVHQAAGMVSAQLDIVVGQALVRLRAHAYAKERRLTEVAADVVAGHVRFNCTDA